MSIYRIRAALNAAIRTAAQRISGKNFSRKSILTREAVIRLLIGAEGGSLDKILYYSLIKTFNNPFPARDAVDNFWSQGLL